MYITVSVAHTLNHEDPIHHPVLLYPSRTQYLEKYQIPCRAIIQCPSLGDGKKTHQEKHLETPRPKRGPTQVRGHAIQSLALETNIAQPKPSLDPLRAL